MKVNNGVDAGSGSSLARLTCTVFLLLPSASLFNSFDDRAEYTIGCHKSIVENPKDCLFFAFALRDIEKGEELVTDYQEFSVAEWDHFGL